MQSNQQVSVTIAGAGCIGRILACNLLDSGVNVKFLTRTGQSAHELSHRGLTVIRNGERKVYSTLKVSNDPGQILSTEDSAIFLCVKCYDTGESLRTAAPFIKPHTPVVLVQNGAGFYDEAAEFLPRGQLFCGIASFGGCYLPDGSLAQFGDAGLLIVPCPGTSQEPPESIIRLPGLKLQYNPDAMSAIWSKLCLSCGVNAVTAVLGIKNGDILRNPEAWRLASGAAKEAYRTAEALGIRLLYSDVIHELRLLCSNTSDNTSSMLQDVNQGRRTEIEYINGHVIRQAQSCGVETPFNNTLHEKVTGLYRGTEAQR